MNSHTCFFKQIRTLSLSNLPLIRTIFFFREGLENPTPRFQYLSYLRRSDYQPYLRRFYSSAVLVNAS